ncbi:MAG: ribosomal protein S18-alanine N-acetyltransferase [Sandaracinobacteroides sp.]
MRPSLLWSIGGKADSRRASDLADQSFDPHFREAWTEAQFAGLLANSNAWLDLGCSGEKLLAFALCRQAFDEVELLLCAVDPAWRRLGIGKRLIERVAVHVRARGARRLFLEVRASNEAALSLYRGIGFSSDGRRPGYYRTATDESIDAMTLSLTLEA